MVTLGGCAPSVRDGATVLLDTSPLIYAFEGHPLAARFAPVLRDVDAGRIFGLVTPVTLAAVVTGPLRAGKDALAERYRRALTSGGWSLRDIDAEAAVLAARLRLRYRIKLPDALQLAVAVREGATRS